MMILGRSHVDFLGFLGWTLSEMVIILRKESTLEKPAKEGGYFTIFDMELGLPVIISSAGNYHPRMANIYLSFSQEKAVRLSCNSDHLSSWESRDVESSCYGGAILVGENRDYIISFSGLPELADEALMLALALRLLWITPEKALEIAKRSQNHYFAKIAPVVSKDNQAYLPSCKVEEFLEYLEKC